MKSHGHSAEPSSPTYNTWTNMLQRCSNPKNTNYLRYGAKGISVCDGWKDFNLFLADMGVRPSGLTLDRIDGDKGYYKNNCRWATREIQNKNRTLKLPPSGYRYISIEKDRVKKFRVQLVGLKTTSFYTLEEAITFRDNILKEI